MKGVWISYSDAELAFIEAHKTMPRAEAYALFRERFGGDGVSFKNYTSLCKRKGWFTGRTGRLEPGNVPVNKGVKCEPGKGGRHPNAQATHFKKGGLPHNTKHLGHRRLNTDGYIEVSVDEVDPHTGYERRYVHEHRYLWQKLNGPIPDDHVLKCLSADKTNTEPSNWELVPRAILPHLNGRHGMAYDTAEPEIKPAILGVAKLKHAIGQRRKRTAPA